MPFRSALPLSAMLLALACSTAGPAPVARESDFSYLRTPATFRAFAMPDDAKAYSTTYTAPEGWPERAARNSFVYWNAVMAVRTGHDCFALESVKMNRRDDMGTAQLNAGAPAGPTTAGAPLATRPPSTFFEFAGVTRFADCAAPGVTSARDYLSRTPRPEQAPRPARH